MRPQLVNLVCVICCCASPALTSVYLLLGFRKITQQTRCYRDILPLYPGNLVNISTPAHTVQCCFNLQSQSRSLNLDHLTPPCPVTTYPLSVYPNTVFNRHKKAPVYCMVLLLRYSVAIENMLRQFQNLGTLPDVAFLIIFQSFQCSNRQMICVSSFLQTHSIS